MDTIETIEAVMSSPGKQSTLGHRIARGLPYGLFLLACAAAGIAAQHYQPGLGILDGLGLPKWAEAVGGISFVVVLFSGLAQDALHSIGVAFVALILHPWMSFVMSVLQPEGAGHFSQAAAQIEEVLLTGFIPIFSAFVPLVFALGLLSSLLSKRLRR